MSVQMHKGQKSSKEGESGTNRRILVIAGVLSFALGVYLFLPVRECRGHRLLEACENVLGLVENNESGAARFFAAIQPGVYGGLTFAAVAVAVTASLRARNWWIPAALLAPILTILLLHPFVDCMGHQVADATELPSCRNLLGDRRPIERPSELNQPGTVPAALAAGAVAGLAGYALQRLGRRRHGGNAVTGG